MEQNEKSYGYLREISVNYTRKRVDDKELTKAKLSEPSNVYQLFRHLEDETKEKLVAIAVDSKTKIICFEVVALGSLNSIRARPAETLRVGILTNAYGLILVHNHPSGDPTPSVDDEAFTKRLKRSCDDMGLHLFDHVIIGHEKFYSFAAESMLLL